MMEQKILFFCSLERILISAGVVVSSLQEKQSGQAANGMPLSTSSEFHADQLNKRKRS
jgi:hypothetical protein